MVYKGCERKMIIIKNPGNGYFDEVYFILKDKTHKNKYVNESDMLTEANRIVNDNLITAANINKDKKERCRTRNIVTFFAGAFSGIISAFLVYAVFIK